MTNSEQAFIDEFRASMAEKGITFDGPLEADGKLHRVRGRGDKKGRRNVWYVLHLDGKPSGGFGSLRLYGDEKFTWSGQGTVQLTLEERAAQRARIKENMSQKEADEKVRNENAAILANKIWNAAKDATEHPYLKNKGIGGIGVRVGDWVREYAPDPETGEVRERRIPNTLLIPIRDEKKSIVSLQGIFDEPKKFGDEMRDKDYVYGGVKRGRWTTIGKPTKTDGPMTLVICEGYATGVSIHMATAFPVVVAFDVGNIMPVAQAFRRRFPDARIVVAADNDQFTLIPIKNPGLTRSTEAAHAINGIVACPQFASLSGNPTDFNDLHQREGDEEVYNQISLAITPLGDVPVEKTNVTPEAVKEAEAVGGPGVLAPHFTILGFYEERWCAYNHRMKKVVSRSFESTSDANLLMLAPAQWWDMNFPSKNGMDKKAAYNWLFDASMSRGIFDPTTRRGRGAWWDDGRSIFNFGDVLTVDGKVMDLTQIESEYTYEQGIRLRVPESEAMSDADGKRLYEIASQFRWVRPASGMLLLGFSALAPLCGAWEWRPHIWLTGASGTGKTTIMDEFVKFLMNGTSIFFQGNSTEAGIRQTLKSDARPVLFDESEQNNERERMRVQNIISMVRQASSDSDAITAKGTVNGGAMHFLIRSMFCLSSVQVNLEHQADLSRMAVLALRPKHETVPSDRPWAELKAEIYDLNTDKDLPARLMRRSLNLLPVTIKNIQTFTKVASAFFDSERNGDQYGTLMAGAWSVVSQREATVAEAAAMFERYDWSDFKEQTDVNESVKALQALLGSIVRGPSGLQATVYELVAAAANVELDGFKMDGKEAGALLRRHGLIVKFDGKGIENGVLMLANTSTELPKLVAGTPYATDLIGQISRVQGAYKAPTQSFNGLASRALAVPLTMILNQQPKARLQKEIEEEALPF